MVYFRKTYNGKTIEFIQTDNPTIGKKSSIGNGKEGDQYNFFTYGKNWYTHARDAKTKLDRLYCNGSILTDKKEICLLHRFASYFYPLWDGKCRDCDKIAEQRHFPIYKWPITENDFVYFCRQHHTEEHQRVSSDME